MRFHAPYLEWAKHRPAAAFDLAGSNVLACSLDDLPGAREALALGGRNDDGYAPLVDAIASRYGVDARQVTTATGTAGANFQAFAALLSPGDDVLIETPGYDPLLGAPRLLGANVVRFARRFEDGYRIDPDAVRAAMTPRTRLIVVTTPHNPSGAMVDRAALEAIGAIAERSGAHVLVDEVYLDAGRATVVPAATLGPVFVSTSSLTKSYGLASLRCGWTLSSPAVAERIRRARDVIDGSGAIVAERLAVVAFGHLDALAARASKIVAANVAIARDFAEAQPRLEVVLPDPTTVIFPRLRGAGDTTAFAEQLFTRFDTAVVPGRFFEAPAHIRVGLGTTAATLRGGLERLASALTDLG